MNGYVPIWVKSNFSFLEGVSFPEELVVAAAESGIGAMALTDRNGVYGVVRAHRQAMTAGLRLLVGAEVGIADGSDIVLLAMNRAGYGNLCALLTRGRRRAEKGALRLLWDDVCEFAEGMIAVWGGGRSLLTAREEPERVAGMVREAFGDRLYAMVARHYRPEERRQELQLRERADRWGIPLVAATEVLYHVPERRPLQDVVTCVRHGVTLVKAGRKLKANGEHYLRSPQNVAALFADLPAAVARTVEVAERCLFSLAELRYRYPSEALPGGMRSGDRLRALTFAGAHRRYGGAVPAAVSEQLERELALIDALDYCGYFLTMWEVVQFCVREGILCQGRGSAANSAVCYCLGITAVDPVRMGLLFERFLSRERAEPPDIDLDIEHQRREEVIQHVYRKYGREHAAMVAVVICYRQKSAIRDVGKVLGMTETSVDRLARLTDFSGEVTGEAMAGAGFAPEAPLHRRFVDLVTAIRGIPRHLSIHPGGFLLGHEPVCRLVPIENGAMADRTVIQWDKDDLETLGLFKVDLLGLGALTMVHRCLDLLKRHRGVELSMATIPAGDRATYEMVGQGDTVGVFQIESRAQMAMLKRMRPQNYYDLVIEVSIVRPGPIIGGMVHPYLRRRQGVEPVVYPHPDLEPILSKTLGVPLFQEQVMRLAMVAANYTPGEADQLRRDMAAWRKSGRIEGHRERLVSGMTAKGIAADFAERVYQQIAGFGEYGFPESHAASFALIAYATAWLKCHYGAEFTCALLNAQPMGFYSPATILEDAKRHGVSVRPVDVTRSEWDCTLEAAEEAGRFAVRMGLRFVKGLGRGQADRLVAARGERAFASEQDVAGRCGVDRGALAALAEAGAFAGLGSGRRQALWSVYGSSEDDAAMLVAEEEPEVVLGPLSGIEEIAWDYRGTGHSCRGHPLEPLRPMLEGRGLPTAEAVNALAHGARVRYVGVVICRQHPSTAGGVVFMTLEDETGFVNLVVWPKVYEAHRVVVKTSALLGVRGRLQVQDGVVHLVAQAFWKPDLRGAWEQVVSRNFR